VRLEFERSLYSHRVTSDYLISIQSQNLIPPNNSQQQNQSAILGKSGFEGFEEKPEDYGGTICQITGFGQQLTLAETAASPGRWSAR
jgi:hypothetical protein